jgi:hypothetical protein
MQGWSTSLKHKDIVILSAQNQFISWFNISRKTFLTQMWEIYNNSKIGDKLGFKDRKNDAYFGLYTATASDEDKDVILFGDHQTSKIHFFNFSCIWLDGRTNNTKCFTLIDSWCLTTRYDIQHITSNLGSSNYGTEGGIYYNLNLKKRRIRRLDLGGLSKVAIMLPITTKTSNAADDDGLVIGEETIPVRLSAFIYGNRRHTLTIPDSDEIFYGYKDRDSNTYRFAFSRISKRGYVFYMKISYHEQNGFSFVTEGKSIGNIKLRAFPRLVNHLNYSKALKSMIGASYDLQFPLNGDKSHYFTLLESKMTQNGFWMTKPHFHKPVFTYFNKHVVPFEVKECQLKQIAKVCRRVNLASTMVFRKAQPKFTYGFLFTNMISAWSHIFSMLYIAKKLTREKNLKKVKGCLNGIKRKLIKKCKNCNAKICCQNDTEANHYSRKDSEMLLVPFTSPATTDQYKK